MTTRAVIEPHDEVGAVVGARIQHAVRRESQLPSITAEQRVGMAAR